MTDKREAWHRNEEESEHEYQLFEEFLRERSTSAVAKKFYGMKGTKSVETGRIYIQNVKRERKWDQRVRAYDRYVAKKKDDAVAEMVQQEMVEIRKQRIGMIRKLARKVNKALDAVQDDSINHKNLFKVETLLNIANKMDSLWRKFEESNPATVTEDKPFQKEALQMQEKLLAMIDKNQDKLSSSTEILQ